MADEEYVTLKDGTQVPVEDFWLRAPMWLIQKFAEPIGRQPDDVPPPSSHPKS